MPKSPVVGRQKRSHSCFVVGWSWFHVVPNAEPNKYVSLLLIVVPKDRARDMQLLETSKYRRLSAGAMVRHTWYIISVYISLVTRATCRVYFDAT